MATAGRVTAPGLPSPPVTQLFHHPDARELAAAFAGQFELVECAVPPTDRHGFHLWAVDDHLELRRDRVRLGVWVTTEEVSRRAAEASELVRACAAGARTRLLDAMSGWGIDALVLARRGCAVTTLEQHPALYALQQDLVRRSGIGNVACRCGDGFAALADGPGYDVVYLDPMFPSGSSALPGKRMQWTAALTAPDPRPVSQWLEVAIANAAARVVLKRRRKDPLVLPPDWQIIGRTVRYDVYRGRADRSAPRAAPVSPPAAPQSGSRAR